MQTFLFLICKTSSVSTASEADQAYSASIELEWSGCRNRVAVEICIGKISTKPNKKANQNCFVFNVNRKHNILLFQIDIFVNLIWILLHCYDENYKIVRIHFGVIISAEYVQFSSV